MATVSTNKEPTTVASRLLQVPWIRKLTKHIPPEQFGRFLIVGAWNSLFGYGVYALLTALLTPVISHGYMFAAVIAFPVNITVSYLGQKWFVFKTRGNYLREWLRCIVVYGGKAVIGISLLPVIVYLVRATTGLDQAAPYIAGALLMGTNVLYGFFAHKNFTFRPPKSA
jgi:putative flippase GtrA